MSNPRYKLKRNAYIFLPKGIWKLFKMAQNNSLTSLSFPFFFFPPTIMASEIALIVVQYFQMDLKYFPAFLVTLGRGLV